MGSPKLTKFKLVYQQHLIVMKTDPESHMRLTQHQMLPDEVENFKREMQSDGYIVVPNIFTTDDVDKIETMLLEAIQVVLKNEAPEFCLPSDSLTDKDILLLLSKVRKTHPELSKQLRRQIITTISYNVPQVLKENVALIFVIEQILGLTNIQYNLFLTSICLPHSRNISEGLLGWHQDLGGAGKYTIWAPILDHDSFHDGYLNFMIGDFGPLPHTVISENINDVNTISEAELPNGEVVRVSCRKGDVIIWNDMALHATGANRSEISRFAFLVWVDGVALQSRDIVE